MAFFLVLFTAETELSFRDRQENRTSLILTGGAEARGQDREGLWEKTGELAGGQSRPPICWGEGPSHGSKPPLPPQSRKTSFRSGHCHRPAILFLMILGALPEAEVSYSLTRAPGGRPFPGDRKRPRERESHLGVCRFCLERP